MNCKDFEELIPLYLDGSISGDKKKELENHLDSCDSCREIYEQFKKIDQIDTADIRIPEEVISSIKEEITSKPRTISFIPRFTGIAAAAAIILIILSLNKPKEDKQFSTEKFISNVEEKIVTLDENNEVQLKTKKSITERLVNLKKDPQLAKAVVFRGGQAAEKRKLIKEWKGFSKTKQKESYQIISDQDKWSSFCRTHFEGEVPQVDFESYIVIAVIAEANEIEIKEVKETNNRYILNITETKDNMEELTSNPYHVVVIKL